MSNHNTDKSSSLLQSAAQTADEAIENTQRMASDALDGVSSSLQVAGQQLRDGASQVSERTVTYIREEPVKSVLIAAATGAALLALARLIGGRSQNSY